MKAWIPAVFVALLVAGPARAETFRETASLGGPTGLINTPTASVLADGRMRFGYMVVNKVWTYEFRGQMNNEVYFVSLGFLPRTEVTLRATLFPKKSLLKEVDAPEMDRMAGVRVLLLPERAGPALAVGWDDIRGTRRFHALYLVASKTTRPIGPGLAVRFSGGYGSRAIHARRHILDGAFGGLALQFRGFLTAQVENDSKKWNSSLGLDLFGRLSVKVVLLHFDALSGGVAWTQSF